MLRMVTFISFKQLILPAQILSQLSTKKPHQFFVAVRFSLSKLSLVKFSFVPCPNPFLKFKGPTNRGRCQEQYLSVWWPLQSSRRPPEAISYEQAESAPPGG